MKYCRFLENIKCNNKIIWERNKEYEVTFEDEEIYYFGTPIDFGINKSLKN
jgi:hypothetical protein